jgi:tubulin alpha
VGSKYTIYVPNDNLRKGFLLFHSIDGGMGSGFTSRLLERLSTDYGKKARFSMLNYTDGDPISILETPVTCAYNQVLSISSILDHAEQAILFDNNRFEGT